MSSYDERAWREQSVESGYRIAENLVMKKRGAKIAYMALSAIGFVAFAFASAGVVESLTLHLALALVGGVAIGLGFDWVGRLRGQRQVVRLWRDSLERPMPTEDWSV